MTPRGQGTHASITVMEKCKWAQTVIPQEKVLLRTNDIFGSMKGLANLLLSGTPFPLVFCTLPDKKNTDNRLMTAS